MNKYSKYLLSSLYVLVTCVLVVCVVTVVNGIKSYIVEKPNYNYALNDVFMSDIMPVSKTSDDFFTRPYNIDNIKITSSFYDDKAEKEIQESSILFYKDTYIQNNGVDYSSEDDFDIISAYEGEVVSIEDNEIYGKVITIKHNDNLKTTYSNVKNVLVSVGYKVSRGEIIATSNKSVIDPSIKSLLHFEIIYKDTYLNPETFYTLNVSSFQ